LVSYNVRKLDLNQSQKRIRIRNKVKIQELWRLKKELQYVGPWTLTMEAWRFKMEP
jgi:hypothetical protein